MDTSALDRAHYVRFTTYRRNGTPVHTPVWVVRHDDGYAFTTEATSGKVKRIGNDPSVEVAVSDARGRVKEGATVFAGRAHVLLGHEADRVHHAVTRKYWFLGRVLSAADAVRAAVRRRQADERAAVAFTVTAPAGQAPPSP